MQSALTNPDAKSPLEYFAAMIDHCYDYAEAMIRQGRPVVGIMCEFTPREIIMAAGAVPVCLCGGAADTIPAAEQHLPSNLCPLIKSTFGYHVTGRNPFLQWAELVIAETTCDGKKKMFEVMGATKEMYVLELPQKSEDPDASANWVAEVRKFKEFLERRFQTTVTDEKLTEAIRLMNRERGLRRQLAELMASDPPPLTGRQVLDFKSIISGIPADLEQYERALMLYGDQAKEPVGSSGEGARGTAKRPVRVLLTGVPLVHGAERVVDLIESCGAVVVCMENCTGLKPILEDVDEQHPDALEAIARKYYHLPCSVMTPNTRRFETLADLATKYKAECMVDLVWHACLTYDIEASRVRRLAEDQLRLPYLKITTDYSPADSPRILSRIEAFLEMARDLRQ